MAAVPDSELPRETQTAQAQSTISSERKAALFVVLVICPKGAESAVLVGLTESAIVDIAKNRTFGVDTFLKQILHSPTQAS